MPQQPAFSVGDLVSIKSGGPVMTVRIVMGGENDYFECQWFAGKKLESGRFPGASLLAFTPEQADAGQ